MKLGLTLTTLSAVGTAFSALPAHERMRVSLFGSTLVHIIVILGIGFSLPKLRDLQGLPTLEITLVQTQSAKAPDKPEFLAQANQDGGGEGNRADIARSPLPVREIADRNRNVPVSRPAPQERQPSQREVVDLFTLRSDTKVRSLDPKPQDKPLQAAPPVPGIIERPDLVAERARLNAEISRTWQEFQNRPRKKYLNARTQEYKYAAYMDAWRAKVERIGNLNYPEEAKRRGLQGSLVLDVTVRADGSVGSIAVRRSSGYKLLDDAATRIVELSAPFSPFPPDIRADTDELHITRTWKFNERLTSEN
ncbi:MAG: energy transducer TonB [Pseudomonadota bacterium]|nr:MAG: energy transducer TonB [Pseudomonadota bacterium]